VNWLIDLFLNSSIPASVGQIIPCGSIGVFDHLTCFVRQLAVVLASGEIKKPRLLLSYLLSKNHIRAASTVSDFPLSEPLWKVVRFVRLDRHYLGFEREITVAADWHFLIRLELN
jgi:hypothetical protein